MEIVLNWLIPQSAIPQFRFIRVRLGKIFSACFDSNYRFPFCKIFLRRLLALSSYLVIPLMHYSAGSDHIDGCAKQVLPCQRAPPVSQMARPARTSAQFCTKAKSPRNPRARRPAHGIESLYFENYSRLTLMSPFSILH